MKAKIFYVPLLVLLVLMVWPVQEAYAQLGFVSGDVVDEEGNPIKDVQIRIEGMNISKTYKLKTNDKGKYIHAGVNLQGVYRIVAEKEGYQGDYVEGVKPGFTRNEERAIVNFTMRKGESRAMAFDLTDEEKAALQKQQEEAAEMAKKLEAVRESFNQAINLYNAGDYEGSAALFKEVLAVDDTQPTIWANLGSAYLRLKNYDEAIAAYNKAVELDPSNAAYYQNLGSAYAGEGDSEKAREFYEKAAGLSASLNPTDAAVNYYNMGVTYINSGKNEEAADALRKAIELDPNHAESHYQLGITLLGLGDMEGAVKELTRYIELAPTSENVEVAKALVEQLGG